MTGLQRSKSSDLLRRLSGRAEPTIGGAEYAPPSVQVEASHSEESLYDDQQTGRRPSRPRADTVYSTTSAKSDQRSQRSAVSSPRRAADDDSSAIAATPDFAAAASHFRHRQSLHRGMSRSVSAPLNLASVPESRPSSMVQPDPKRISDVSSGVHSRNAALLSAESGGMMLAFSPSDGGVYRMGDSISPAMPVRNVPTNPFMLSPESRWNETNTPRPRHHRSLSDGAMLVRQGTLLHPASSVQRSSEELGVLLGAKGLLRGAKTASQSRLMDSPGRERPESEKVRLEAAKKRRARVEVDVVLERDCVVEGGEVRGRMEVVVYGGKRGDGLRVGGGKIRVLGFEGVSGERLCWERGIPDFQISAQNPVIYSITSLILSHSSPRPRTLPLLAYLPLVLMTSISASPPKASTRSPSGCVFPLVQEQREPTHLPITRVLLSATSLLGRSSFRSHRGNGPWRIFTVQSSFCLTWTRRGYWRPAGPLRVGRRTGWGGV